MLYILSLIIFLVVSFSIIPFMDKFKNIKLTNIIFVVIVFVSYLLLVYIVYKSVGLNDWNFQNTLPVANVSPFMFCVMPIVLLLPQKIKKHFLLLVSLLSVGMLLSPICNCIFNVMRNYRFIPHFLLDYMAHFALFLFGVYIVKSKQVNLNIKNSFVSSSIIIGVALFMLVVNVIFNLSFFGLSLNGKHNIYNLVLVSNSYLSAAIYFSGLIIVLLLGFCLQKLISRKR